MSDTNTKHTDSGPLIAMEARLRAECELHAGRLERALRQLREFQLSYNADVLRPVSVYDDPNHEIIGRWRP